MRLTKKASSRAASTFKGEKKKKIEVLPGANIYIYNHLFLCFRDEHFIKNALAKED